MSFVEAARLVLLGVTIGVAAICARVMVASINEGDAVAAWISGVLFVASTFLAAWYFWRVL